VLHLSTRWGFASLRKLALKSMTPPTPYDQLVLARAYSVDEWVLPALTALCERTLPLSLDEARDMRMEDVIMVATVREDIRGGALRVDAAEIPRYIEVAQVGKINRPVGPDVYCDRRKGRIASEVDPNMEAEIAKIKGLSGPQQKEGDTDKSDVEHSSKEALDLVEPLGAAQPHVMESTARDCPEKAAAASVGKTKENHAVEATDTVRKMNAEIIHLLGAADRAYAEKTSKKQEKAARAKGRVAAEARARADVKERARKKQEEANARVAAAKKAAKEMKALWKASRTANTSN